MITRQKFIHCATASTAIAIGAPFTLQACSSQNGEGSYEAKLRDTWRPAKAPTGDKALLRQELVRYATLAPSSHNTQCWKFRVENDVITILPDLARRTPAVDPDDHHLYVSLGCAAENLVQAALANGLKGDVRFDTASAGGGAIKIALEPTQAVATPFYLAIPERQCTRGEYDGKPVSTEELRLLQLAGTGAGVRVLLLTEKAALENVLAYVVEGNTAQMNDPAFVEELKGWIRFGSDEAVKTGGGLYSATSGNPSVPRWIGSPSLACSLSRKVRTTSTPNNCAALPGLRFLSLKSTTKLTGLWRGAAMNGSPCKLPPWAFATRWSTSRWKSPKCGPSSQVRSASTAAGPIWWCVLAVAR